MLMLWLSLSLLLLQNKGEEKFEMFHVSLCLPFIERKLQSFVGVDFSDDKLIHRRLQR